MESSFSLALVTSGQPRLASFVAILSLLDLTGIGLPFNKVWTSDDVASSAV